MTRRRRLGGAYLLGSLLVLTASLHPVTAYSAPGDPPSGSPAGAVYELPLEGGRADAAPKGDNGTSGGGAGNGSAGATPTGGGEAGSLYRSENNFGSSSRVPGTAAGTGGDTGKGAAGRNEAPGGTGGDDGGATAAQTADTGNTSVSAGIVLLGAIGLLAAAIGVLSRRFSRG